MTLRRFWSRPSPRKPSGAARPPRRPRLQLERLEDRALPSVGLAFDAPTRTLELRGDAGPDTVRQALSPAGFLEVAVAGRPHSSDPTSASFDPALAGASAGTLVGIRLDGGAQDTLILGSQKLPGGLRVVAPEAAVTTEDVAVGGALRIEAHGITVGGALRGSAVELAGSGLVAVEAKGRLDAQQAGSGGSIEVTAAVFVNSGQVQADGPSGGQVAVRAGNVLNAGRLSADGSGPGGAVRLAFTGSYIDTTAALTSASGGAAGRGGAVTLDGGATGRLFSSGSQRAVGAVGGSVDLLGREVELVGARVDASGGLGGGSVRVGGDFQGGNPGVANAQSVAVAAATTIRADALRGGGGGRVIVWSDQDTAFAGVASARGGPAGGPGGFLEVSGKGGLSYGGRADAGAAAGKAGTLLLDPKDLIISAAPVGVFPQFNLIDPHPSPGGSFGASVLPLSTGNVVVTNPADSFGGGTPARSICSTAGPAPC
jgi:hypothetical protein